MIEDFVVIFIAQTVEGGAGVMGEVRYLPAKPCKY
jgi:hypothetical protein